MALTLQSVQCAAVKRQRAMVQRSSPLGLPYHAAPRSPSTASTKLLLSSHAMS